jgi:plasmid replication initiation protein
MQSSLFNKEEKDIEQPAVEQEPEREIKVSAPTQELNESIEEPVAEEIEASSEDSMLPAVAASNSTAGFRANKIIVQHNNLINGRFDINSSELRVLLYMLASIKKDDTEFKPVRVPVSFIASSKGGKTYKIIRSFQTSLVEKTFTIELLEQKKDKVQRRFKAFNIFAEAEYLEGENALSVIFSERIKPYLLQITGNFTSTELQQVLNLKNVYSYRIYWLLKQYHKFGERTIDLEEFREMLMLKDKYPNFFSLKPKVLDIAKEDLKDTDMAFEYEPLRKSNKVYAIKFTFKKEIPKPKLNTKNQAPEETDDLQPYREYFLTLDYNQQKAYETLLKFNINHPLIKYYIENLHWQDITKVTYKAQLADVRNKIGFITSSLKDLINKKKGKAE